MILRGLRGTVALCGVASVLAGCGGSGGTGGAAPLDPYAGFGFSEVLYRGTLTVTDANGNTTSSPVGVTYRRSRDDTAYPLIAFGLVANDPLADRSTFRHFSLKGSSFGRNLGNGTLDSPLFVGGADGDFRVQAEGVAAGSRTLKATFDDMVSVGLHLASGTRATLTATLDDPDLTPIRPTAGAYEGQDYGRNPVDQYGGGNLWYAGPAWGRIEADGTFSVRFLADRVHNEGDVQGKIGPDGTVTDVIARFDGQAAGFEPVVRVCGSPNDLTIVVQDPEGKKLSDTYRMHRTGD